MLGEPLTAEEVGIIFSITFSEEIWPKISIFQR